MSTLTHALVMAGLAAAAACSAADRMPTTPPPPPGGTPGVPSTTFGLHLEADSAGAYFPGMQRSVVVWGGDDVGRETSAAGAVITISDTALASLSNVETEHVSDPAGHDHAEIWGTIRFLKPGTVTLSAALGDLKDERAFTVHPVPALTTAVAVDSFTVIESTCPECGGIIEYLPILRLHGSNAPMAAIAMQVNLPADSTVLCSGSVQLPAGQSADLFTYPAGLTTFNSSTDWFDWPYYFFSLERNPGDPEPDGPASARVIVRDSSGAFGLVQATGTIQRNVVTLDLPRDYVPAPGYSLAWVCT